MSAGCSSLLSRGEAGRTLAVMSLGIKERDAMEPIQDVVSEVRAFRLAIQGWAKGYATARRLTRACAKVDGESARADLKRWSHGYFATLAAQPA